MVVPLSDAAGATSRGGPAGLSLEATALTSLAWDSPESSLEMTLAALDRPLLRFGGNAVDRRMWWTSSQEAAPEWAETTVTPEDLARIAATAERADADVIIAAELGHTDAARAAEAFAARVVGVAIGNELNRFHHPGQPQLELGDASWDEAAHTTEVGPYEQVIRAPAPDVPITGPGVHDVARIRAFTAVELPRGRRDEPDPRPGAADRGLLAHHRGDRSRATGRPLDARGVRGWPPMSPMCATTDDASTETYVTSRSSCLALMMLG